MITDTSEKGLWGIERSVFLLVGENGRKALKTNRFRHGMGKWTKYFEAVSFYMIFTWLLQKWGIFRK